VSVRPADATPEPRAVDGMPGAEEGAPAADQCEQAAAGAERAARLRSDHGAMSASGRDRKLLLLAPSVADIVFLLVAGVAAFLLGGLLFNGDGDLGTHIRMGQETIRGGIVLHEVLSYTRAGAPLVPYEWLSEVAFAGAYRWAGLAGDVALAAIVLGAAYGLVTLFVLRRGGSPVAALMTGLAAAIVGAAHWAARPHLFTLVAVVLVLFLLEAPRRRMLATFLLFAVWANVHGGFPFGLVLIGLYVVGELVDRDLGAAKRHATMLAAAVLGPLVNPVGPRLYGHILGFFGSGAFANNTIVDSTVEFLSPNFHDPGPKPFLLATLLIIVILARTSRKPTTNRLLVISATIAMSLLWRRNIGLFSVTGLPLAALLIPTRPSWASRVLAVGEAGARPGIWAGLGALAVVVAASGTGGGAGRPRIAATFLAHRFPVAAVDAARAAGLGGRLYNDLDWGGYVELYWPGQRVFIDGRTDFFGPALFHEYMTVAGLDSGWRKVLDEAGVSIVLVPSTWRVVEALRRDPGWRIWYEDGTAAVAVRATAGSGGIPPVDAAPGIGP
jgi:hypothetical protein